MWFHSRDLKHFKYLLIKSNTKKDRSFIHFKFHSYIYAHSMVPCRSFIIILIIIIMMLFDMPNDIQLFIFTTAIYAMHCRRSKLTYILSMNQNSISHELSRKCIRSLCDLFLSSSCFMKHKKKNCNIIQIIWRCGDIGSHKKYHISGSIKTICSRSITDHSESERMNGVEIRMI